MDAMNTGTPTEETMDLTTNVEASGYRWNHDEAQVARARGLQVKSGIKAGPRDDADTRDDPDGALWINNHNETRVQERSRGLTVKTGVKAGDDGDLYVKFGRPPTR